MACQPQGQGLSDAGFQVVGEGRTGRLEVEDGVSRSRTGSCFRLRKERAYKTFWEAFYYILALSGLTLISVSHG